MNRAQFLVLIALINFTICSVLLVHNYHLGQRQQANAEIYNQLEVITPKMLNELLDLNFDSKQHYDNFSQLQLQLDRIKLELIYDSKVNGLITEFNDAAFRYMELATMLKTSKRLIAFANLNAMSAKQQSLILQLNNLLNHYVMSANEADLMLISELKLETDREFSDVSSNEFSWNHYKQHYLFILNNLKQAQTLKQRVQDIDISSALLAERARLAASLYKTQLFEFISMGGVLMSFVIVFIALLTKQQQQLQHQNALYKEAAEVKSRFLANMSHEIRTPMTGIIGLTELCLSTNLSGQQKDYLSKLHFSATSLLVIINDILDFSKIESGKMAIENVEFEHTKLFDNLSIMLGKVAKEKSIELIYDLDENVPHSLIGDPVRVGQILLNLVNNAVKFTEKGHVMVKSRIVQNKSPDNVISIEYQVIDTGIGLSEEQCARLFNRFEQADDSTTRKYGGTGLGLSIVKLLVELLGGEIKVTSKVGEGSCFTVSLPFKLATELETTPEQPSSFVGKHILIIEDNPITQLVLQKMAQQLGLKVVVTNSVNQAVSVCELQAFDYAIIDWHLTGESGIKFIEQADKLTFTPARMIVCSAFELEYIQQQNPTHLEFEFIGKPLTSWSLQHALEDPNANLVSGQNDNEEVVPKEQTQSPTTKEKILLVEDNKVNQTIAGAILTKLDVPFDLAENGQQAVEMVMNNKYQMILMDIQMPVMDGVSASIIIRKQYTSEDLPIIALTANVTKEEVDSYLEVGMNDHLGKPYDLKAIEQVVAKFC